MITPIEIIDSAVKIGLGAIISGLATYWLAKANYSKTIEKERTQRKIDMLETVARQVASFDQVALRYWQTVANWLDSTHPSESMSETTLLQIKKLEDEVSDGFTEVRIAATMLKLYSELKCSGLLEQYANSVQTYRANAIIARDIKIESLREYQKQFRQKREDFLTALSDVHGRTQ